MEIKFKDFLLSEALKDNKFLKGSNFLYHYTGLVNLKEILQSNKLLATNSGSENDNKIKKYFKKPYVSLTRSKNFHKETNTVNSQGRITLDANKLKNNYIITPYEYSKNLYAEFEERIWFLNGDGISNLDKYIISIDIFENTNYDMYVEHKIELLKEIQSLAKDKIVKVNNIDIFKYLDKHKSSLEADEKNKIYGRGRYEFKKQFEDLKYSNFQRKVLNNIVELCRHSIYNFKVSLLDIQKSYFVIGCKKNGIAFDLKITFTKPKLTYEVLNLEISAPLLQDFFNKFKRDFEFNLFEYEDKM